MFGEVANVEDVFHFPVPTFNTRVAWLGPRIQYEKGSYFLFDPAQARQGVCLIHPLSYAWLNCSLWAQMYMHWGMP